MSKKKGMDRRSFLQLGGMSLALSMAPGAQAARRWDGPRGRGRRDPLPGKKAQTDTPTLVFVHGWQTDGPDANYTLFSWSVSATPGSTNMTISAPTDVTIGQTADVEVSWSGLDAGTKYLGAVSHGTPSGLAGLTVVSVATD